jgi:hypothetical protein
VNPLLELRPWAQISFNDMSERMLILPGDNIAIKYGASKCKEWNSAGCLDWEISEEPSDFEGVRLQPDIHSSQLPEPFKTRYTSRDGQTRLPCNDVMIADSL